MIAVSRTRSPKPVPPVSELGWGRHFTDHMFTAVWNESLGWHDARIVPYGPVALYPAAAVLHYSQSVFDGLKAFRTRDGVKLFRLRDHVARLGESAKRLCIPPVDTGLAAQGIRELVRTDQQWVPAGTGNALYLRPTIIATEPFLGVRPALTYLFFVIASPVGAYYGSGLKAVKIWIESGFVRASEGGLGGVKAGANYAASLLAAEEAKQKGFDQVLWLDGRERNYLEEVGTMNLFLDFGDEVVTPPLKGTILGGVTRDSVLTLLRRQGVKAVERPVSVDELLDAHRSGRLKEVWGSGTGASISPVGELAWKGERLRIGDGAPGQRALGLYRELNAIQYGETQDTEGWLTEL